MNVTAQALLAGDTWLRDDRWAGNTPLSWICAGAGVIVGFVLVRSLVLVVRGKVAAHAERRGGVTLSTVHAALRGVRSWLVFPLAVVIALDFLTFGHLTTYWLHVATFLLVGLQVVLCINRVIVTWLRRSVGSGPGAEAPPVMLGILTWVCQFAIWVTFLLALLTNAGVNITAFVASLGIGGIAVALALQNILGDLFASVAIGLDKPFEPGEYIAFGGDQGTVKHVGVKTTRIASLSGEELAIANSKLLDQLVHNYSRMPERRIVFGFTVPYETTGDQLREITARTSQMIEADERVRFDRGHFTGFGDYGFTFEFVYHVLDSDYTLYLDIQQALNHQIMDTLESIGVHIAVPARTVTLTEPPRG